MNRRRNGNCWNRFLVNLRRYGLSTISHSFLAVRFSSEDATEEFKVKKSSVSRRLMKQKKRMEKQEKEGEEATEDDENRRPTSEAAAAALLDREEDGLGTKKGRKKKEPESWTLSGR